MREIIIDFTEQIITLGDEKAGYPPKCNAGYEASEDGKKCVPVKKDNPKKEDSKAKKPNFLKKKDDKKDDKKDGKKDGKKGDKGDGEEKDKNGKKLPPWLKKKQSKSSDENTKPIKLKFECWL